MRTDYETLTDFREKLNDNIWTDPLFAVMFFDTKKEAQKAIVAAKVQNKIISKSDALQIASAEKNTKLQAYVALVNSECNRRLAKRRNEYARDQYGRWTYTTLENNENAIINTINFCIIQNIMDTLSFQSLRENKTVENNAFVIIETLLNLHPNLRQDSVCSKDEKGVSLVMLAADKKLATLVELFIRYGADLNVRAESIGSRSQYHEGETAADLAVRRDFKPELIAELLTEENLSAAEEKLDKTLALCNYLDDYCYRKRLNLDYGLKNAVNFLFKKANFLEAKILRKYYVELRIHHAKMNKIFLNDGLQILTEKSGTMKSVITTPNLGTLIFSYLRPSKKEYEAQAKQAVVAYFNELFTPDPHNEEGRTNNISTTLAIFQYLKDLKITEHLRGLFGNSYLAEEMQIWFDSNEVIPPQFKVQAEEIQEEVHAPLQQANETVATTEGLDAILPSVENLFAGYRPNM